MRTFDYPFDKLFNKGLVPDVNSPHNGNYCTYLRHVKPTMKGLTSVVLQLDSNKSIAYQYFMLQTNMYAFSGDTLYQVDITTDIYTVVLSGIPIGAYAWSMIDFGTYAIFGNGSTYVVYSEGAFSVNPILLPLAGSMTYFKGRVLLGDVYNYLTQSREANKLIWSDIGNLTFLSITNPDATHKNTAGFMYLLNQSTIIKNVPMGDNCIIYTSNAIYAVYNATVGTTNTLGLKQIADIGIVGDRAVVENDKLNPTMHWFIGTDYQLHSLDVNLKLTTIGYNDYLRLVPGAVDSLSWCGGSASVLAVASPMLSYNRQLRELYISDSTEEITYILTEQGMGMMEGVIYNVIPNSKSNHGLYIAGKVSLSSTYPSIDIVSDVIDFGYSGLKCIEYIDFGMLNDRQVQVAVEYRDSKSSLYSISSCMIVNNEGFVKLGVRGIDFRIRIHTEVRNIGYTPSVYGDGPYGDGPYGIYDVNAGWENMSINKMKIGIQSVDKRFKRGIEIKN